MGESSWQRGFSPFFVAFLEHESLGLNEWVIRNAQKEKLFAVFVKKRNDIMIDKEEIILMAGLSFWV